MTAIDRGVVEDGLPTPTSAECLQHDRRSVLSPRQRERHGATGASMVEASSLGLTVSLGSSSAPTVADLDLDVRRGSVDPVDRAVAWVRTAERSHFAGRYRLVLDEAFGTAEVDRAANRAGRVGRSQRALVRSGSHGLLGQILLVAGLVGVAAAAAPASALGRGSAQATMEGKAAVTTVGLLLALPGLAILIWSYVTAPRGRVLSADGLVSRVVTWTKRFELGETLVDAASALGRAAGARRAHLVVAELSLDAQHLVDLRVSSAIVLGIPHPVWFEETTRAVVAVEPLGP